MNAEEYMNAAQDGLEGVEKMYHPETGELDIIGMMSMMGMKAIGGGEIPKTDEMAWNIFNLTMEVTKKGNAMVIRGINATEEELDALGDEYIVHRDEVREMFRCVGVDPDTDPAVSVQTKEDFLQNIRDIRECDLEELAEIHAEEIASIFESA